MRAHKITPIHYEKLIRLFEIEGFAVKRKNASANALLQLPHDSMLV
jgi:hypothetical protein